MMVKTYNKTPSEVLRVKDEYIGYCLDEVVSDILARINNGEEVVFKKQYTSFSEMYKNYS